MIISGFQKMTLLDYPQKIAAIVFTQGCNLACGYCHNPEMIPLKNINTKNLIQEEKIINFLKERIGLLEGIVITGGEPTLQKDLKGFIKKVKKLGFLVKLDTNGSNPEILKNLINENLIDYIAMDLKYSKTGYEKYIKNVPFKNFLRSIEITKRSGIDYEFRSTILPHYHSTEDLKEMGELIKGAKKWYLQNFRPYKTLNPKLKNENPFIENKLKKMKKLLNKYTYSIDIR